MPKDEMLKVLVIDDNSDDATILGHYLKSCDWKKIEMKHVVDLPSALESLANEDFNLIFLDNRLGAGATGLDVLSALKSKNIGVPVIIVTGQTDEQMAVELMKLGAYDYIKKDAINTETLNKLIGSTLERHDLIRRQKELKKKLKQLNDQQQIILDSVPALIWYSDEQGRVRQANKAAAKAVGFEEKDMIGKTVAELFKCSQDENGENVLCSTKPCSNMMAEIETVYGKRWFQIDKVPYQDQADEKGVIVFAMDITERKLADEKMLEAEEKLIEQNRLKSNFVVNVSHELRTPLCIFKNIISNAMSGVMGVISPKLRTNLEIADSTIGRLAKIINDFLDVSKIETGRIQLNLNRIKMRETVKEAVAALRGLAKEKDISLSILLPPAEISVFADRELVIQIITNLVSNAIKFTQNAGTIRVEVKDMTDEVEIDVVDSGVGMSNDSISKIFNRFVQVTTPVGPGTHGTGLGLYIAKKLVEFHGGRIWAESTPGQGSIFCFSLPKAAKPIESQSQLVRSFQ